MPNRPSLASAPRTRRSRTGRIARLAAAVLLAATASTTVPSPAAAAVVCGPRGTPQPTTQSWPVQRLDPASAWPLSRGAGITVAVIDSGVSATHPVLRGKVLAGKDLGLPNHGGWCDEVGHGTLIASIIAGRPVTGNPFVGMAPDSRILPVRVLRDAKKAFDPQLPFRIAQAIVWAVDNGADLINLSLETVPTPQLANAVRYAVARKVVLVAAAGNQQSDEQRTQPAYPAGYPLVLAVAGVDEQGSHVGTSISGDYIDVAAPGLLIEGPAPGGGYRVESEGGTSFAAAYVTGVAALVRSAYPQLPANEVMNRIVATADNPPEGRTGEVGFGVVNPYRAVSTVLGKRDNPPLGAMPPPARKEDPLRGVRTVAVIAGIGAVLLALLVLLGRPIIRRGRQRGWRAGPTPESPATPRGN